ncbi:MAG: response regulator [Butyrivibrio sp.]|nr:response regulator [Butyrivibrio sp.]
MKRIMIVDDDPMSLKQSHFFLKEKYRVTTVTSGEEAIRLFEKERPDLVLSDLMMPEMDGFEMLKKLRRTYGSEIPVMFMTAEENKNTEAESLNLGAVDFILKPFTKDVLIHRIENILNHVQEVEYLKVEATIDRLTGIMNQGCVMESVAEICRYQTGILLLIDLDNFKAINDIYGHDKGDKILVYFAEMLKNSVRKDDIVGRLGGDEFLLFLVNVTDGENISALSDRLNTGLKQIAEQLFDNEHDLQIGASIGAVHVPEMGREYETLFQFADKALYHAKQSGKHGFSIYRDDDYREINREDDDIESVIMQFSEHIIKNGAFRIGTGAFTHVYHYFMRYSQRYDHSVYQVLFTLRIKNQDNEKVSMNEVGECFAEVMSNLLRKSDIFVQTKENQFFLMLPDISESDTEHLLVRMIGKWKKSRYSDDVIVNYVKEAVEHDIQDVDETKLSKRPDWVVVVDDDMTNLKMAGHILSKNNMRVTALKSGYDLLEYIDDEHKPDLILLDIMMPGIDGFETLKKLREKEGQREHIPVIFLTADDDDVSETKGLQLGAMDFIKKPFVPEVLIIRVRHIIDLIRLQSNLRTEVEQKKREVEKLSVQVVAAIADAIDAKDTYTNGHSGRVATYSREIAKRAGYNEKQQNEIYIMGLLHDVGKIGIPDAVINKPAKLTEEEYELIKNHPVMGARILKNISEMPKLATGARWHHERYDGKGYPDGLSGLDIPEEARIIAVADAYDAMTSHRSYRDVLPQGIVREQFEEGRGTQFDPRFADIMLQIIEEDIDYQLHEE